MTIMMMMMIMTDPFTTNLVVKGPVVKGSVVKGAHPIKIIIMVITKITVIIIVIVIIIILTGSQVNIKSVGRTRAKGQKVETATASSFRLRICGRIFFAT